MGVAGGNTCCVRCEDDVQKRARRRLSGLVRRPPGPLGLLRPRAGNGSRGGWRILQLSSHLARSGVGRADGELVHGCQVQSAPGPGRQMPERTNSCQARWRSSVRKFGQRHGQSREDEHRSQTMPGRPHCVAPERRTISIRPAAPRAHLRLYDELVRARRPGRSTVPFPARDHERSPGAPLAHHRPFASRTGARPRRHPAPGTGRNGRGAQLPHAPFKCAAISSLRRMRSLRRSVS